jgi:3-oxoadipate enol-lactonase
MDIESSFAEVNGTRLYYEIAGAGDALVFVHGFSLDSRMWDDQFSAFAERFRVLRYDLRGFGNSQVPSDQPYGHEDDLNLLLDELNIERAHVVALSLGGQVAVELALQYPGRLRSLVLADSTLAGVAFSPEWDAVTGALFQTGRTQGVQAAMQAWFDHPLFAATRQNPAAWARVTQIVGKYSGWAFVNPDPAVSPQPPAVKRLHEIIHPTLVIVGERDVPDFQRVADLLAQGIPNARKSVLPGVGHVSNMEDPAGFNALVLDFLAGV